MRTVTGPRAKQAQRLITEIVAAQRILSEDASREKYNALITESPLAKTRGVAPPAVSTPAFEPPAIDTLDAGPHHRRGGRGGGGRRKDKATEGAKTSNALWWSIITMCIVVLILTVTMVLSKNAKREASRKAEIAMRDADRRAKMAHQKLKAAQEAESKRKEEAEKKPTAIAKEKAEAAAKKKAEAKRREEERKAQELRDNPDKLLKSKGFEQKGGKWVFARKEKLGELTNELIKNWRNWKTLTPQNKASIKTKLEIYNKLLLESFEISAMRMVVSEDFHEALDDPDVDAALSELEVKENELTRDAKALKRLDSKLRRSIPKGLPIIPGKTGHFYAALIIAEKESAIIHLHPEAMSQKDSPNLFILPRAKWDAAGRTKGKAKQVMFSQGYRGFVLETSGLPIRCGLNRASNPTVHLPLKPHESGTGTDLVSLGGKAGSNAWKKFFSQMKPHTIEHSLGAIKQARQKLDAYQPKQKK